MEKLAIWFWRRLDSIKRFDCGRMSVQDLMYRFGQSQARLEELCVDIVHLHNTVREQAKTIKMYDASLLKAYEEVVIAKANPKTSRKSHNLRTSRPQKAAK